MRHADRCTDTATFWESDGTAISNFLHLFPITSLILCLSFISPLPTTAFSVQQRGKWGGQWHRPYNDIGSPPLAYIFFYPCCFLLLADIYSAQKKKTGWSDTFQAQKAHWCNTHALAHSLYLKLSAIALVHTVTVMPLLFAIIKCSLELRLL